MALSHIGESSISLADLRSRRVPVEWFEAIAVIQELSRVLVESGDDPAHLSLAPQDISIDRAGSVRVIGNTARGGESVVRRVGELLQMSIADSAFPVPLRLVITQAVATPPFYASLGELASALEYFERPDRTGLIRTVYERAQTHRPTSDVVEQPVQPTEKKNAAPPRTRRGRRAWTRAIGVSVAALAVIAIGVAVSQVATWPQGSVTAVEQPKGNASDEVSADPSPRKTSDDSGGAAARILVSAPHDTDVLKPRDIVQELSSTDALATMDTTEPIAFEPVATSEAAVADAADATIYSAGDDDVTPPVATYPRLSTLPPAGVHAEDHSTIELLVGETGLVESVKLLGRPHDLGEAMLVTFNLSAAKTWRFRPAVRDGHPVRYRTLVPLWQTTR